MSHSHMPVQHLLKQVEIYKAKRAERDSRPDWLTEFIQRAAEVFEPFAEFGRVGFDCRFDEDRWVVGLYLGKTEIVGGKEDGHSRHASFKFDLAQFSECFSEIDEFHWTVLHDRVGNDNSPPDSFLQIQGRIEEFPLRVDVFALPPNDAGPGFHEYPDGTNEPA